MYVHPVWMVCVCTHPYTLQLKYTYHPLDTTTHIHADTTLQVVCAHTHTHTYHPPRRTNTHVHTRLHIGPPCELTWCVSCLKDGMYVSVSYVEVVIIHVTVPDRNQILLYCIFRAHHQVECTYSSAEFLLRSWLICAS